MKAEDLYREGRLNDAVDAMNEEVRKHPADLERRAFLSELLCIAGNLDRADKLLETVLAQSPGSGTGIALVRQLIRAERARQEFYEAGRVPEVLVDPTEGMRLRIRASILLREGDMDGATKLLHEAEEKRTHPKGTIGGQAFEDLRDLDDLVGDCLEVLTSTGKFYWIPMDTVVQIAPRKPERPLDLLWLPVEMTVREGPEGVVYLPTTYAPTGSVTDEQLLLGRATEWVGEEGQAIRGHGQRTFLIGDEATAILELGEISFTEAASGDSP